MFVKSLIIRRQTAHTVSGNIKTPRHQ